MICGCELYHEQAYLVELNDVRVADELENVDLARNALEVRHVGDALLLEDLDGDLRKVRGARLTRSPVS